MDIIMRLTWRYMKQNRRRTIFTILGIGLAVCALTTVVLFTSSMKKASEENVIQREGGWHVIFHDVTGEQVEKIAGWKKAKEVYTAEECQDRCVELVVPEGEGKEAKSQVPEFPENKICISVEMKHPGIRTLKARQIFAEEIGMTELLKEEQGELSDHTKIKYRVTYHDELLQYHGVFSQGAQGMGALSTSIFVVIILLASVCIYNSFAVSVFEKMRYLGMLGSVGATKFQKASCVLIEGMLEGVAGIVLGFIIGISVSFQAVKMAGQYLMGNQMLFVIGLREILLILVCSVIFLLAACTMPSKRAANASVLDLLIRPYPQKLDGQKITSLKKPHRILGVEGTLALKNIFLREKEYSACIGVLSLSLCVLMVGTTTLKARNGDYTVRDTRVRPETEICINLMCPPEKMETFFKEMKELPEVKDITMERKLTLSGILVSDEDMVDAETARKNPEEAELKGNAYDNVQIVDKTGRKVSGNLIQARIIAVDDNTFSRYAKTAGISLEHVQKEYPVIIEDYQLQRIAKGKDATYQFQPELREMKGEEFHFVFSRQADMKIYQMDFDSSEKTYQVEELVDGNFYVLGTTQEVLPGPKMSGEAIGIDEMYEYFGIWGEDKMLDIYMPSDTFARLLQDEAYQDTYKEYQNEEDIIEGNSLQSYMSVNIQRASDEEAWTDEERKYFHNDVKMRAEEDEEFQKKIEEIAERAGIKPEEHLYFSAAIELESYQNSEKQIMRILGYGAIALIVVCALTGIIQKISASSQMRRKEVAILLSMGMTKKSLRRMITIENSVYGIVTGLFGIPFSIFLMKSQMADYQNIVLTIPYHLIGVEIVIVLSVTVIPVLYGFRQLKGLDVIKSLKEQSC